MDDSVEVSGTVPGGFSGKIKIRDRLSAQEWLLFLILLLNGVLIYLVIDGENDRERRYGAQSAAMTELINQGKSAKGDHEVIKASLKEAGSEQRIQTYILALDPVDRKKYNLMEPDELRARRR